MDLKRITYANIATTSTMQAWIMSNDHLYSQLPVAAAAPNPARIEFFACVLVAVGVNNASASPSPGAAGSLCSLQNSCFSNYVCQSYSEKEW